MRQLLYISLLLLMSNKLKAQIVYDTIENDTNEVFIGWVCFEKFMIFENFDSLLNNFYLSVDYSRINANDGKAFVSATFGKDGKIKDTKVLRSSGNSYSDSIAYKFIDNLKNWIPGLQRGRFVDIEYAFPMYISTSYNAVQFNDEEKMGKHPLTGSQEEFAQRKKYFDFINSNDEGEIINDFNYFCNYVVNHINDDNTYTHLWEYRRPSRKEMVKVDFGIEMSENLGFLIIPAEPSNSISYIPKRERSIVYWDWGLHGNFIPSKKNGVLYLEKEKKMTLVCFTVEGGKTNLALIDDITFTADTAIELKFKEYQKKELMDKLKYNR